MNKMLASALTLPAVLFLFLGRPLAAPDEYEFKETRELVALVNDAATLVGEKGESAFEALRVKEGPEIFSLS